MPSVSSEFRNRLMNRTHKEVIRYLLLKARANRHRLEVDAQTLDDILDSAEALLKIDEDAHVESEIHSKTNRISFLLYSIDGWPHPDHDDDYIAQCHRITEQKITTHQAPWGKAFRAIPNEANYG